MMLWACTLGCHRQEPQGRAAASGPPPLNPDSFSSNRVATLDGTTASIRVTDSPSLHSLNKGLTLELWFKAASFSQQEGTVNSLLRKNVEAGGENFFLRFRIMGGKPVVEMSAGNRIARAPYDFEPGIWYHLAGTYDGAVMTVFVNGVFVSSARLGVPIQIDDSDLFIGKGDPQFSEGEYFDGAVDEIRIWSVARSAEQIRTAMSGPLSGNEPGLVAYWNFEDGTAKDLTANGNNGELDGEARIVGVNAGGAPSGASHAK